MGFIVALTKGDDETHAIGQRKGQAKGVELRRNSWVAVHCAVALLFGEEAQRK
jgi:hypothetical protein